jgi:glucose/arabinose dehydrogenase
VAVKQERRPGRRVGALYLASACLLLAACAAQGEEEGDGASGELIAAAEEVALVRTFPQLSFTRPVDLQHPGNQNGYLYAVEQAGRILAFDPTQPGNGATVVLDIRDRVDDRGNEEGLLGLAFHPDWTENGFLYVNYTANSPSRTVISRFSAQDPDGTGPANISSASERTLLEFDQPYNNHNGGQIAFGPEGYLYVATGDGGSGGDPQGNGQDRTTLLGAILRIDVDAGGPDGYGIPPDSPYAGNSSGYREEIYAYGLRNPWRFSFDPQTGALWTGDVGQNAYEEIDVVEAGGNYGWNIMEGRHCYEPPAGCDQAGLIPPVAEYPHAEGRSVTGGFVYRGTAVPALRGRYVYADFVSGRFWTLSADEPMAADPVLLFDTGLNVSSFGVDRAGELYALAFDGHLYRFEAR